MIHQYHMHDGEDQQDRRYDQSQHHHHTYILEVLPLELIHAGRLGGTIEREVIQAEPRPLLQLGVLRVSALRALGEDSILHDT